MQCKQRASFSCEESRVRGVAYAAVENIREARSLFPAAQKLTYLNTAAVGWLNQPLVQLPWFRYIPPRLQNPGQEILLALVVFLMALLLSSVAKTVRKARKGTAR